VHAGGYVYTSGQIPLDRETGELVASGFEDQVRQVMTNLAAVLNAAGADLGSVIKTTCFLTDMSAYSSFNAIYAEFFRVDPPARSVVQVAGLPLGAAVEVEAVAVLNH
jgi:2-iminobutanoate/2-iminopropanoate deaminase